MKLLRRMGWVIAALGLHPAAAQTYFPPVPAASAPWDTVDPAALGWCPEAVEALHAFADSTGSRALLVLQGGRIAVEGYYNGHGPDSAWYWASAGKSVMAALCARAMAEGDLTPSTAVSSLLGPGWSSASAPTESSITVSHLLTMTSGFDDGVPDDDCWAPECLVPLAAPGTRWAYHNAPYTLLHEVLPEATGLSVNFFLNNRLFAPIGAAGLYLQFAGDSWNRVLVSKARDAARFGLLAARGWQWNGQYLIADSSLRAALTAPSTALNPSYGWLWWLNGGPTHRMPSSQVVFNGPMVPAAPPDLRMALGRDDQKVWAIPSLDLVVVRLGENPAFPSLAGFDYNAALWSRLSAVLLGCCPADLDGSGTVDVQDLLLFLPGYGCLAGCPADLSGDGAVGTADLNLLLAAYGTPCP